MRLGLFGHFFSHLSFLVSFSLSLGNGPIQTEIQSRRAIKPKTTNQPNNLLHSEGPKLYGVLALLNAIGLKAECLVAPYYTAIFGFVSCIFVNKTYREQTVFIGANISMIDRSKLEKSVKARFKM